MTQENNNWQQQVWQQPEQAAPVAQQPPAPQGAPVYAAPTPAVQQPKKRGWIVALVAVVLIFVFMVVSVASCTSIIASSLDGAASFTELSYGDAEMLTGDAVAVINISGTIQYDGTTCSPDGLKAQLDRAADNNHIKAVVLRVDSGGGVATAGEEMSTYLNQFKEATNKPVVVSCASMNASAAYEISSQADYIFTAKTSAVGAIGTAYQVTDLSGLMEKLGIRIDNITSADSKDSSYGTRALSEEERAYYQNMVDSINETFIATVAEGRGMGTEEVRKLATGLTYTGMEAVENGLADEIGTKEDAIAWAANLANTKHYEVVHLDNPTSGLYELLGLMSTKSSLSADDIAAALKEYEDNGSIAQ